MPSNKFFALFKIIIKFGIKPINGKQNNVLNI